MADASKFFPSSWLKAEDLGGRTVKVRTAPGDPITQDKDIDKPVLRFIGLEKGLVLNKTNNDRLRDMFGDQTDAWGDKEIELYIVNVPYKGEEVPAIRVRKPESVQEPADPEPEEKKESPDGGSSTSKLDEVFEKFAG